MAPREETTFGVPSASRGLLNREVRYGVRQAERWASWQALMSTRQFPRPADYVDLVAQSANSSFAPQVRADLPRTFPQLAAFDGHWQLPLERMLLAYAALNPQLGYCQGMSFVAAVALLVADGDEEAAFWFVAQLLADRKVQSLFERGLPGLGRWSCAFERLLAAAAPTLAAHLASEEAEPALYLHRWFLSLFADGLPLADTFACWDAMLRHGADAAVLLALGLLLASEAKLMELQDGELFMELRKLGATQNAMSMSSLAKTMASRSEDFEVLSVVFASLRDELSEIPKVPENFCGRAAAACCGLKASEELSEHIFVTDHITVDSIQESAVSCPRGRY